MAPFAFLGALGQAKQELFQLQVTNTAGIVEDPPGNR